MGRPLALLTADGKVYEITGDLAANKNEKLVGHIAHTIEVTGDVTTATDGAMKIAGTELRMVSGSEPVQRFNRFNGSIGSEPLEPFSNPLNRLEHVLSKAAVKVAAI